MFLFHEMHFIPYLSASSNVHASSRKVKTCLIHLIVSWKSCNHAFKRTHEEHDTIRHTQTTATTEQDNSLSKCITVMTAHIFDYQIGCHNHFSSYFLFYRFFRCRRMNHELNCFIKIFFVLLKNVPIFCISQMVLNMKILLK